MARSLMTLLCVRLELAYHMSYCLLHLHIHFDSHTQRRRKANDYFARVGCRSVNPSHYANGLCVNRLDMAAGDKHRLKVFWLDDSDRGLFSLSHAYLPLRGRRGRGWPKREANKNLAFASPPAFRSELLSFPAGKHDDQVDALGLIGQLLDQMAPGQKPRQPEKPKVDSGYRPVGFEEQPLDWMMF